METLAPVAFGSQEKGNEGEIKVNLAQ